MQVPASYSRPIVAQIKSQRCAIYGFSLLCVMAVWVYDDNVVRYRVSHPPPLGHATARALTAARWLVGDRVYNAVCTVGTATKSHPSSHFFFFSICSF
ncbi:hypothetical protein WOLCODRAFT_26160 [Wolfiporia cocos MD-104 SS10]|uniref:Uncharacterized protein n=1 Tax=Wolfiporia cocos (strain MD-104) TaxID=742152 RepID=A0A2H3K5N3_WOLCO|nr:hypothetical protein WOLCODRAFT_26160 [Wolfiporia cocos MD-104 SS10]